MKADGKDALTDSGFIVRERGGNSRIFGGNGLLAEIRTASGKSTRIERDSTGAPQSITANNRVWFVGLADGNITSIQTPTTEGNPGRISKYGYSEGVLTSYTNLTETPYCSHTLTACSRQSKPDNSKVTIEYGLQFCDGISLVTSTTDEEGNIERFEYPEPGRHTTHINQSGVRTDFYFDDQKRTIREERADGTVISTLWRSIGDTPEQRVYSTRFASFTESYDDYGDIIFRSYPDGSGETWERNEQGSITRYLDRDGIETSYAYDERGNMITESRQGKIIRELQWNETGNPIQIREHGLGDTELSWNKAGLPASRVVHPVRGDTDKTTARASWSWDGEGRITMSTDACGMTTRYLYGVHTVSTVYPSGLRVTEETDKRAIAYALQKKTIKPEKKGLPKLNTTNATCRYEPVIRTGQPKLVHTEQTVSPCPDRCTIKHCSTVTALTVHWNKQNCTLEISYFLQLPMKAAHREQNQLVHWRTVDKRNHAGF